MSVFCRTFHLGARLGRVIFTMASTIFDWPLFHLMHSPLFFLFYLVIHFLFLMLLLPISMTNNYGIADWVTYPIQDFLYNNNNCPILLSSTQTPFVLFVIFLNTIVYHIHHVTLAHLNPFISHPLWHMWSSHPSHASSTPCKPAAHHRHQASHLIHARSCHKLSQSSTNRANARIS